MATKVIVGPSVPLLKGGTYRARVRLSGAESVFGTAGALRSKFEDLGFSSVVIFGSANDLPPDWPSDERTIETGDLESGYFAQGVWTKPNDSLPRPAEILAIWLHAAPPRVKVDYEALAKDARRELLLAWAFEFPDTEPTLEALQAILAIGYFEGKWGMPEGDPVWQGSNNWGAVQDAAANLRTGKPKASDPEPDCGPTAFAHVDHDAKGNAYWGCFRKYTSMREGARDLIRVLHRMPHAWEAIDSGNATKLAFAMHADKYFELEPAEYAKRLASAAKTVAALTGDPLVVKYKKGGGWWWVFGFAIAGVGTGGTWWYQRRGAHR
jgi:hypothetical protein